MAKMFYKAHAYIFGNARALRKNMTRTEKKLWDVLSNKKMKGFRFKSQHPINAFIVDFYCHKAKLVIQVDGEIHNKPEQSMYDKERTLKLESLGLKVIRFTNVQIEYHLEETILEIEKK